MMAKLKSYWPIIALGFIATLLGVLNYSSGTFLTGGDNLHPEFNLLLNIKRSIFSVWQEYQGVGLLGGMGHSSDLLRQIFLGVISVFFPTDILRYLTTFLTLFIGSVGAYFLIRNLFLSEGEENDRNERRISVLSFLGASFYLFNLSTLQAYYVPFEVFSSHFAALPWLVLSSINYFRHPKSKNLFFLALTLFLSTPSAYVPTLFLVFLMASAIIFPFFAKGNTKSKTKQGLKYLALVFIINAFWILPFLFFTLTSSNINVSSKINQMATENIFLQNKEFGGIFDIMLLKGFWLNNVEPNLQGDFVYMLGPWKNHLSIPVISIGYLLFGVVILGFLASVFKIRKSLLGFSALFIFVIFMLTTSTPPFSMLNNFLRENLPLFNQIFRFPFTKFSILASLVFAIFFSFGMEYLVNRFSKKSAKSYLLSAVLGFSALIILCFPMFTGNLFYSREKTTIPKEYFHAFEFFKNQDKNTRIANFPQFSFWGWYFYRWGYSGSGFIWYGIEQPILDRNFDVWSNHNEAYYWELSNALYSKNPNQLKSVFNKYQVSWIMVDKNLINPSSYKSLFTGELEELLRSLSEARKVKDFGNIEIYSFKPTDNIKSFVYLREILPKINDYGNSAKDLAYSEYGNYISTNKNFDIFYPFRSLLTSRNQEDIEFEAVDKGDFIEFSKILPENNKHTGLTIPSLVNDNNMLAVELSAKKEGGSGVIYMTMRSPRVSIEPVSPSNLNEIEGKTLWESIKEEELFRFPLAQAYPLTINVNGVNQFVIQKQPGTNNKLIARSSLSVDETNLINLSDSTGRNISEKKIESAFIRSWSQVDSSDISLQTIPKNTKIVVRVPKVKDQYQYQLLRLQDKFTSKDLSTSGNCDNFRKGEVSILSFEQDGKKWLGMSSKNATACVADYMPTLDHDQAYFLEINHKNITGRGLHVWILNEDQKVAPIDTFLPRGKGEKKSILVLPPYERFGKAYSIHFDNQSVGTDRVENYLGDVVIYPIPYSFIERLKLVYGQIPHVISSDTFNVSHPNSSQYSVKIDKPNSNEQTLILSQAYNPGWMAFSGFSPLAHKKVNNWQNGWEIKAKSENNLNITIIYLPQFLQYFGFIILASGAIYAVINKARKVDSRSI